MKPVLLIAGILFTGSLSGQVINNSPVTPDTLKSHVDNIIHTGYGGSHIAGELPGSIIRLQFTELNRGFISSPEELITGRMPGLSVTSLSGAPGAFYQL